MKIGAFKAGVEVFPLMKSVSLFHSLLVALSLAATSQAEPPQSPTPRAAKPPGLGLKDGDRWIFIGDSITHQCLYTQFVENFYFTRHPELKIDFRNAGISGDRAADVLDRFDDDIAAFKPTIATILLGMNDGSYKDFDSETFKTYEREMTQIMDRLDALKCRVIVMSPTMFDHQAWDKRIIEKPDYAKGRTPTNYNAVLAYYGKWLQETARARGYSFVDLFGPLNTFTTVQRQADPAFTLIPDAIHPEVDGQFIMAYALLQQCGETGPILSASVRLTNGAWQATNKALVTKVSGEPGRSVSYEVTPKALPWAQFMDAPLGTRLTKSGHQGGAESHIAVGMQPGRYDLVINGQTVGTFDDRMLAVHAEVQEDPDSPTCQQALQVLALNKKRNEEAVRPMRGLYAQRKGKLRAARQSGNMASFDAWWVETKKQALELDQKADTLADEIRKAARPKPLKVEIKPASVQTKPVGKAKKKAA